MGGGSVERRERVVAWVSVGFRRLRQASVGYIFEEAWKRWCGVRSARALVVTPV
jgi:hypothetical protein